jgi:hypothetical protein
MVERALLYGRVRVRPHSGLLQPIADVDGVALMLPEVKG